MFETEIFIDREGEEILVPVLVDYDLTDGDITILSVTEIGWGKIDLPEYIFWELEEKAWEDYRHQIS